MQTSIFTANFVLANQVPSLKLDGETRCLLFGGEATNGTLSLLHSRFKPSVGAFLCHCPTLWPNIM